MASLLEIKKKIGGVKNTRKITKAMQLVAASKMQQFQKKALQSRGYIYSLLDILNQNLHSTEGSIYSEKRTEGATLFVLYTSDKGLCGALNTKLINALFRSNQWKDTPEDQRLLVTIGKKSQDFAKNNKIPVEKSFTGIPEKMSELEAIEIVDQILEFWRQNKCKEVVFVSSHYLNSFTSYPVKKLYLPLSDDMLATHINQENQEANKPNSQQANSFMYYNPSEEHVLEKLHEQIIQGLFVQSFLELKASEYSSRMIAMKNATDSADKMIKQLSLTYNKARQSKITQEIAELVGAGAAAE